MHAPNQPCQDVVRNIGELETWPTVDTRPVSSNACSIPSCQDPAALPPRHG